MDLYMALTTGFKGSFSDESIAGVTSKQELDLGGRSVFKTGTTAGKADKVFANSYTLAGAGVQTLDLAGGVSDYRGVTITMAKIRGYFVEADSGNGANVITFTRPASNGVPAFLAAGDGFSLAAGEKEVWDAGKVSDGRAVTASTGDLLTLTNTGAGSATVRVGIIGTSA